MVAKLRVTANKKFDQTTLFSGLMPTSKYDCNTQECALIAFPLEDSAADAWNEVEGLEEGKDRASGCAKAILVQVCSG